MRWRRSIWCIFLVLASMAMHAQKLTFGMALRYPQSSSLETNEGRTLYFADDINSAYKVSSDHALQPRSIAFPELHSRYLLNDNVFLQYQLGFLSYLKTVNILYNSSLHNEVEFSNSFDYSFLTNQLSFGYRFLRGKEMRLTLSADLGNYYLMRFKEVSRKDESLWLKNQHPYGQIIHQDYASLADMFFVAGISGGIEYYLLTLKVSYQQSFTGLNEEGDFYTAFRGLYLTAGLNLLNFHVKSKKLIRMKQYPGQ